MDISEIKAILVREILRELDNRKAEIVDRVLSHIDPDPDIYCDPNVMIDEAINSIRKCLENS